MFFTEGFFRDVVCVGDVGRVIGCGDSDFFLDSLERVTEFQIPPSPHLATLGGVRLGYPSNNVPDFFQFFNERFHDSNTSVVSNNRLVQSSSTRR
jgi:hypothetical protein